MRIKDEIYNYLLRKGSDGATDEQIQSALKISPDSERPARVQLVKDNRVVDSGKKRSVPHSNRKARIWVAIRQGGQSMIDKEVCPECNDYGYVITRELGLNDSVKAETKVPCCICRPDEYIKYLGISI